MASNTSFTSKLATIDEDHGGMSIVIEKTAKAVVAVE